MEGRDVTLGVVLDEEDEQQGDDRDQKEHVLSTAGLEAERWQV
jgi:hypothetical protein